MERKLTIGILELTCGWDELLHQVGVDFKQVTSGIPISKNEYALIIVNRVLSKAESGNITEFITQGGIIIDMGYCIPSFFKGRVTSRHLSYCVANDLPFKPSLGIIDIYSKVKQFSKASLLNKTLYINSYQKGLIAFLGIPVDSLLGDTRSKRKHFYAHTPRLPHEEVSCVSKGSLTRLLFFLMRHLFIKQGLPFVHKWFFPKTAKNVFLFRIDSDYGTKEQVERWYSIAKEHDIRYTWFLHVSAHEKWLTFFKTLADHEVAIHGYNHFTTNNYRKLVDNISHSKDRFEKEELAYSGYAAPYGLWGKELAQICEEFSFNYSSEFSYAYDSLPQFPTSLKKKSSVLQIPIHPICFGTLIKTLADEKAMHSYFKERISEQITLLNPLIFYDHLLHNHTSVLSDIFAYVKSLHISNLTFSEYATWWKSRNTMSYSATVCEDSSVQLRELASRDDCYLCLWQNEDSYILTNRNGRILIPENKTEKVSTEINYSDLIVKKMRRFNMRAAKFGFLNRLLWREYK